MTLSFSSSIDLPSVPFVGRTLAEYVQTFSLDLPALRGRAILDVAAGPSSFTAEAFRRGIDAVAVDPLYGYPVEVLATHVQLDYTRVFTRSRDPQAPLGTIVEAERQASAQRFLADYESGFLHNRYIGAALPRLPFFDGAFDLVVCGDLLFAHPRQFDFEWHLTACCELARISAGDVRIHPLGGTDGREYSELGRLRRELKTVRVASEVVPVREEVVVGGRSMLVLKKQP